MTTKVLIIGSINVDKILHIDRLPQPGETISTTGISTAPGGKGANQAVAAARSGAEVSFVGAVGTDDDGRFMLEQLRDNHVDVGGVVKREGEVTGQAYILLQVSGQNSILLEHGANGTLDSGVTAAARERIQASDFVIAEFETTMEATIAGFKIARKAGRKTILNPAPAVREIPEELLALTDIIIPNETESEMITGIAIGDEQSLTQSAEFFHQHGIKTVIITLGERGSFVSQDGQNMGIVSAFKVKAVDTTAAGDTFIGALASELQTDLSNLSSAVRYASKASSLTVQTLGAFPSIPTRASIEAGLAE